MLTEPFDAWPRVAAAAARKALVSFGLPLGGGPDLAQDIILIAARKYDPAGPARPLAWCVCVAKRLVLGELRKRQPEFHAELEEPAVDESSDGPGRGALDAYLEGVAGAIPAAPAGRKRDRVILVLENPGRQLDDMRRHIGVVNVGPEREQVMAEREALWTEAKACWKNGERPEADRLRDAVALRGQDQPRRQGKRPGSPAENRLPALDDIPDLFITPRKGPPTRWPVPGRGPGRA